MRKYTIEELKKACDVTRSTTDMTISQLEDAIKICNKKIENKN